MVFHKNVSSQEFPTQDIFLCCFIACILFMMKCSFNIFIWKTIQIKVQKGINKVLWLRIIIDFEYPVRLVTMVTPAIIHNDVFVNAKAVHLCLLTVTFRQKDDKDHCFDCIWERLRYIYWFLLGKPDHRFEFSHDELLDFKSFSKHKVSKNAKLGIIFLVCHARVE